MKHYDNWYCNYEDYEDWEVSLGVLYPEEAHRLWEFKFLRDDKKERDWTDDQDDQWTAQVRQAKELDPWAADVLRKFDEWLNGLGTNCGITAPKEDLMLTDEERKTRGEQILRLVEGLNREAYMYHEWFSATEDCLSTGEVIGVQIDVTGPTKKGTVEEINQYIEVENFTVDAVVDAFEELHKKMDVIHAFKDETKFTVVVVHRDIEFNMDFNVVGTGFYIAD